MPILEKGCCCLPLQTCVRIMSWLNMISGVLYIWGGAFFVAVGANPPSATKPEDEWVFQLSIGIGVVFILMGAGYLFMGLLLYMGGYKENVGALRAYLIIDGIMVTIGVIMFITTWASLATIEFRSIINILVSIYYFLCVYSYLQELTSESVSSRAYA